VTKIVFTEQSAAGEPVVRREISVSDFFSVQGGRAVYELTRALEQALSSAVLQGQPQVESDLSSTPQVSRPRRPPDTLAHWHNPTAAVPFAPNDPSSRRAGFP